MSRLVTIKHEKLVKYYLVDGYVLDIIHNEDTGTEMIEIWITHKDTDVKMLCVNVSDESVRDEFKYEEEFIDNFIDNKLDECIYQFREEFE